MEPPPQLKKSDHQTREERAMTRKSGWQQRPALAVATAMAIIAGGALSGCAIDDDPRTVYCTDEKGNIVDEKYCDTDDPASRSGGGYFIWIGNYPYGLPVGSRLPSGPEYRGQSARATDSAARSRIGAPATGKVTVGKPGGFGGGKSGGGGFGGGSKGGSGS